MEFATSRRKELKGMEYNGMFVPVARTTVAEGTPIFGSRFTDDPKRSDKCLRRKNRLVAQNYCDVDSTHIETKAPTVQISSQRLVMILYSSIVVINKFPRDVTQAYIQITTDL